MRDIATATRIRAIAFTPLAWGIRRELLGPDTPKWRVRWLHLVLVGLSPVVAANAVVSGIAAIKDTSHRQLFVSADRQVVATIKDPQSTCRGHQLGARIVATAVIAIALTVHFIITAGAAWIVGEATHRPAVAGVILLWIVLPFAPLFWRIMTLRVGTSALTLKRVNDLTIEGFARTPTSTNGSGSVQLVQWLPTNSPIHGVAFRSMLPTYQSVAGQQKCSFSSTIVGEAWGFGRWTFRETLHELRIVQLHSSAIGVPPRHLDGDASGPTIVLSPVEFSEAARRRFLKKP